ncbi:MAG: hypothetical protein V4461_04930 [Pseudomonadota bacterium]
MIYAAALISLLTDVFAIWHQSTGFSCDVTAIRAQRYRSCTADISPIRSNAGHARHEGAVWRDLRLTADICAIGRNRASPHDIAAVGAQIGELMLYDNEYLDGARDVNGAYGVKTGARGEPSSDSRLVLAVSAFWAASVAAPTTAAVATSP